MSSWPEWLPDGWIMETRKDQNGTIYKYYTCPITDYTFCKEEEVLLFLKMMNDENEEYEIVEYSEREYRKEVIEESVQIVRRMKNLVDWLPRGWIMEVRQQEGDEQPVKKYKCYVNKSTGTTFYSKEEVLQFLQSGNEGSHTVHMKNSRIVDSNVVAEIEYSPDGAPPGWIRENTYRGGKASISKIKDPFYLDPVSGFVFRTQKDVALFTDYGIVSKYCYRPRKKGVFDMELVGSLQAPKAQEGNANKMSFGGQTELMEKGIMNSQGNAKRKSDKVTEQEVEESIECLSYLKEKEDKTVKKLSEAHDDMSAPLEVFYRKARKSFSKFRKCNVSDDKISEQSSFAQQTLSGEKELSLKSEVVETFSDGHDMDIGKAAILIENLLENETINSSAKEPLDIVVLEDELQGVKDELSSTAEAVETFSDGHDMDIGKAAILTENSLENEIINSSAKETSDMVVLDNAMQGARDKLLTTEEIISKTEEITPPKTKGNILSETDKEASTSNNRATMNSPRRSRRLAGHHSESRL